MNISFLDFWDGFRPDNNFFIHLFKELKGNISLTHASQADLIIFSCFGQEHKRYNHCKKIFYTGENIRPNFNECDYSITFDFDDYDNRNIRIPLWYLYIDWFNVKSYGNPEWLIPTDYLNNFNPLASKHKIKFCSTVFSNPKSIRMEMVSKMNLYKNVDCYGKVHALKLSDGEFIKMKEISNYKFNICFENSVYPGYFTEKLLHAKIAGTIPLYYSDKTFDTDFNDKCCLNLINYNNFDELIDKIKQIDNDDYSYNKMKNEPLFNSLPDLNNIKKYLNKII
jgi:hypothetical protein